MSARLEHDCRIRNIDRVWRTHCNCGWRSGLHPDSSTAWSEGQSHVVSAMEANNSIDEARRAALWESQLDADGWQVDPDLLAAQERVRAAERADNRFYREPVHVKDRGSDVCIACHETWPCGRADIHRDDEERQISESAPQTPASERLAHPSPTGSVGGAPRERLTGAANAGAAPAPTWLLTGSLDSLEFAIADYIWKWGQHLPGVSETTIAGVPTAAANMAMTVIRKHLEPSPSRPSLPVDEPRAVGQ